MTTVKPRCTGEPAGGADLEADVYVPDAELEAPQQQAPQVRHE